MPAVRHALKKVENNLSQTLAEEAILNKKKKSRGNPRQQRVRFAAYNHWCWSRRTCERQQKAVAEQRGAGDTEVLLPGRIRGRLCLLPSRRPSRSCPAGDRPRLRAGLGGQEDPWPCRESLSVRIRGAEGVRGLLSRRGHPACRPVNL